MLYYFKVTMEGRYLVPAHGNTTWTHETVVSVRAKYRTHAIKKAYKLAIQPSFFNAKLSVSKSVTTTLHEVNWDTNLLVGDPHTFLEVHDSALPVITSLPAPTALYFSNYDEVTKIYRDAGRLTTTTIERYIFEQNCGGVETCDGRFMYIRVDGHLVPATNGDILAVLGNLP